MELGLSLGEAPTPFSFLDHKTQKNNMANNKKDQLGFCMALGNAFRSDQEKRDQVEDHDHNYDHHDDDGDDHEIIRRSRKVSAADPGVPIQLDLLPSVPVPRSHMITSSQFRFPWLSDNCNNRQPFYFLFLYSFSMTYTIYLVSGKLIT